MSYCPDVPCPTANSPANALIADVLGNPSDTSEGSSLLARARVAHAIRFGIHNVYPRLAAGVTVAKGTAAWTLGDMTEIIPANTIDTPFVVTGVSFASISASNNWKFFLYAGAAGVERQIAVIGQRNGSAPEIDITRFTTTAPIPANTRISARIWASGTADANVSVILGYVRVP